MEREARNQSPPGTRPGGALSQRPAGDDAPAYGAGGKLPGGQTYPRRKQALDLLAAWPLCDTEQLRGLMGGVTRRRVNQMLRSLSEHGLIPVDDQQHVLTDEELTYLARRDRASVGQVLDR